MTLWDRLQALARIGAAPDGQGLVRWPFTPAEAAALAQVRGWMEADGLTTRRDAAGNLFGRREGADPAAAAAVLVGSHLDTVRGGGAYDGALGVLGAMEALRALPALRRTVEVVAFTNEEGNRYPGLFGSRALAGALAPGELERRDPDGVPLREAMTAAGLRPDALAGCAAPTGRYAAYLELHIEQGPVLEAGGTRVGIVERIVGMRQGTATFRGRADHAGTTPMDRRADALRAAAAGLTAAYAAAEALGRPAVLTCGRLAVRPGSPNVVPAAVELTLDMRDADPGRLDRMAGAAHAALAQAAAAHGVDLRWEVRPGSAPTQMDATLCDTLEAAAADLGLPSLRMTSGAGHDAMALAPIIPVAMLFVPCRGGRSHAPEEFASPEACADGAAVLREALRRCAS